MKTKAELLKDGNVEVQKACASIGINLVALVARTAIWAHPDVVKALRSEGHNPDALWAKNCRRLRKGDKKGAYGTDGCYLDSNVKANYFIKVATGKITKQSTYAACHIYEKSCYDKRYHTSLCNLVLLPLQISSLADSNIDVIAALKYRSFALYGFYIGNRPRKPVDYDRLVWSQPAPHSESIKKSISRRRCDYLKK